MGICEGFWVGLCVGDEDGVCEGENEGEWEVKSTVEGCAVWNTEGENV